MTERRPSGEPSGARSRGGTSRTPTQLRRRLRSHASPRAPIRATTPPCGAYSSAEGRSPDRHREKTNAPRRPTTVGETIRTGCMHHRQRAKKENGGAENAKGKDTLASTPPTHTHTCSGTASPKNMPPVVQRKRRLPPDTPARRGAECRHNRVASADVLQPRVVQAPLALILEPWSAASKANNGVPNTTDIRTASTPPDVIARTSARCT